MNEDKDRYETALFIVPSDGSAGPGPLTTGPYDTSPRWSPDGQRLAFVRALEADGKPQPAQIYVMPMDGGEPRAVTTCRRAPRWAPDGATMAFISTTTPDDLKKQDASGDGSRMARQSDVRVITRAGQADFTLFQPTWFRAAPSETPEEFAARSAITRVAWRGSMPSASCFSGTLRGVPPLVSLDDIAAAATRIRGIARRTPIIEGPPIGNTSIRLFLKCENLQVGGAFKIRGAYNLISRIVESGNRNGVITYSSGNHGQAVAFAARLLSIPAVVVMPTTAPPLKIEGAREYGAEVILEGTTSAHRQARAETEAARRGLTMIPPFDDLQIIAGQGTVGTEILEDCGDADRIYVPVGGGGLIAGIAAAVKQRRPEIQIEGVEPTGAARMKASLDAGHPVTLEHPTSLADGLLPVRPGGLTFAHARAFVDRIVTVDDGAIARAVVWLFRRAKLVVEPSGAASVAAVFDDGRTDLAAGERRVVAVLSGGNIAPDTLAELARISEV